MRKIITKKTIESVIQLYVETKLTVSKIAKINQINAVTVYNILRRNNIETKYKSFSYVKEDKFKKEKLAELKLIAVERGGILLSEEYLGARKKLSWKCAQNHLFEMSPRLVLDKKWCANCSPGLHESLCRHAFETLFNKKFLKFKADWLISEKGYKMEIDGYCPELNIAFEYNGIQHYKKIDFFKIDENVFEYRKRCDQLKIDLCKKYDIRLIIIPTLNIMLKLEDLGNYIIKECDKINIKLEKKDINYNEVYKTNSKCMQFQNRIENIIKEKNGELIEGIYITCKSLFKLKCNRCEKSWNSIAENIIKGSWCPCDKKKNFARKTKEEELKILEAYKAVKNVSKISRELRLSRSYITKILKINKIY
jgi:hypothetical protein